MRRKIFFATLVCMLLLALPAMAKEKGNANFTTTTIDMGTITENGGPRSATFEFVNVGGGNMVVTGATAQCGCTKPEYSEAPVGPGKKGAIKVTYNPKGRPGAFSKTIMVRLAGDKKSKVVLKIKGIVK